MQEQIQIRPLTATILAEVGKFGECRDVRGVEVFRRTLNGANWKMEVTPDSMTLTAECLTRLTLIEEQMQAKYELIPG